MKLTAEFDHGGGDSDLWIRGGGSCLFMAQGNRMVRSPLDEGFGDHQPEYDGEAERRSPQYQEHSLPPGEMPGPATDR